MRIEIHPGFNALYYSFYVEGLRLLGLAPRWRAPAASNFGHHGLAVTVGSKNPRRLFISASDGPGINPGAMDWCDIYAKVNLSLEEVEPDRRDRCLSIGPSFGIRTWGAWQSAIRATQSLGQCRSQIETPREHVANYWRQYRYRLPETAYQPGTSDPDYVFLAARVWKTASRANDFRANFFKACRRLPIAQEGGFLQRSDGESLGYSDLVFPQRYELADYLAHTRRSCCVFNTPAVDNCHGWKLGEFLALGKAIISTPLSRELPSPLIDRRHLHYTDGSVDSIEEAIETIRSDEAYRVTLENNAREYYETFLSPTAVMKRCFEALGQPRDR